MVLSSRPIRRSAGRLDLEIRHSNPIVTGRRRLLAAAARPEAPSQRATGSDGGPAQAFESGPASESGHGGSPRRRLLRMYGFRYHNPSVPAPPLSRTPRYPSYIRSEAARWPPSSGYPQVYMPSGRRQSFGPNFSPGGGFQHINELDSPRSVARAGLLRRGMDAPERMGDRDPDTGERFPTVCP